MKKSGVYRIRNKANNHIYIGSSNNILYRIYHHFHCLRHGKHDNDHLQKAYNKYGEENFRYKILEECNPDELLDREQYYIDNLNPEYNITRIAGKVEMTESVRKKISDAQKGVPRPYAVGLTHTGHKWTDEEKERIAEQSIGRTHTKEARQKISNAMLGNQRAKGFHWSDEERQKISDRMKGNTNRKGVI